MAIEISIHGHEELAQRLLGLGRDMPLVMVRAVKRTAGTVQTAMIRQIMQASGLQRALVRQSINLKLATAQDLSSLIRLWPGRRPLIKFSAAKRRELTPTSAFRATMPSGHEGIFQRKHGARAKRVRPGVWHSLPIEEVQGPPMTELLGSPSPFVSLANDRLLRNLNHEIEFLVQQRSAG